MPCLTAEDFTDWQQAYDQDPWGEERQDMRQMAHLMLQDPEAEVSPIFPYWEDDESLLERKAELDKREAAIDPEVVAAKFAAARQKHLEAKAKRV